MTKPDLNLIPDAIALAARMRNEPMPDFIEMHPDQARKAGWPVDEMIADMKPREQDGWTARIELLKGGLLFTLRKNF